MNVAAQSNALPRTGRGLSWLVALAVTGSLCFMFGMVRSNSGHPIPDAVAQILAALVLGCEAVAVIVLLVGIVRWPLQIFRSPRWLLSALGVVLVAVGTIMFLLITITVAIALP